MLSLYKQLVREGSRFTTYNFREYAKRRIRDEFKENKQLTDGKKIDELIHKGKRELEGLRRQTVISNMYHQKPLIIETKGNH